MQSNGIDLLFPSNAIEGLRNLRDESWENLVKTVIHLEADDDNRIAFVLLMAKISGCATCQSDSYRAMRGCATCSNTTIKRYKGSHKSLIDLYTDAQKDVIKYMCEVKYE